MREHEVVPASEIIHLFVPMRAHQTRGVPWMHAAMLSLNDLGGYREAAIVAARVGAAKMGIIVSPTGEEYAGDDKDNEGNIITEAEPGTFEQVAEGTTLESWDPTYPHDQFESFNKAMLRGMAGGLGVAYHTFASDLEGVNFSSARAGVLEERDMWMVLQQWLVEGFNAQVFPEWLMHQMLSKKITLPSGIPLPFSKFAKFNAATWQPRRWSWVDPLKDIKANREAIDARVRSISSVIRETGADPDDVFLEIQTEREKLDEMGIPPESIMGIQEQPEQQANE
jgi:lambda family phage portal protein